MENLNLRFEIARDDCKPAGDNAYDYFHKLFGIEPLDYSLLELPIESNCGIDCKEAIDWIFACGNNWRHEMAWRMASSHIDSRAYAEDAEALDNHHWGFKPLTMADAATIAFNAIEIYWRG